MALGLGTALWACILPVEKSNLLTCPSYEFGRTGQSAALTGGVTDIGTTSAFGQFGAWSMYVVPSAAPGTSGAYVGTWSSGNGTDYTASAYVRGSANVPYVMAVADFTTTTFIGSVLFTGGGTWQRYSVPYTETGDTVRRLVVGKASGNNAGTYYVDGVQVELGSITTYFDGDQPGCTWNGVPHASTSTRSGQYRGGGSVVALSDLGLQVDQMPGVGMPPIENSAQSYAIIDGAQFQRQRAAQRQFTLTAKPINGTSLGDFHVTRRTLIDAFKPDLVTPQQPVRLIYVGAQGTQQIDAYYQSGLELGNMQGPIAEDAAIGFVSYDPYWYRPTQEGTTLVPVVNIGSVNYMARRSPLGAWGTMGQNNGTTIRNPPTSVLEVDSLAVNQGGTVFIGGNWGTFGGTTAPHIGMYFPTSNTFGTLAGGTIDASAIGPVRALAFNPGGTLFLGGAFPKAAGTTCNGLARWTGAFGTLIGGTVAANSVTWALLYSPTGTLFIGGNMSSFAGTTNSANAAMWTLGGFGTLGGTVGPSQVSDLAWGLDQTLYLGGLFTTANGTQGTAIARWKNGTLGTMSSFANSNEVDALAIGPNGYLYEGGVFNNVAGGSALKAAVWNGVQHSALGAGLGGGFGAKDIVVNQQTGNALYVGRIQGYGSVDTGGTVQFSVWNGALWLPPDLRITSSGYAYAAAYGPDGALYIGGEFTGTAQAASIGTIVNTGRAQVYPILRLRNTGAGTAAVYQLVNITTGAGIYFQSVLLSGEQVTLTLQPGNRSYTSNFRGNVFGDILPGSNLASWSLQPGTNYISFFSDSSSLEPAFFWQPKGHSIDSGTVN